MSLLSEAMVACKFMEKTRVPDGEGGYIVVWVEGADLSAAITYDTSIEARVGEAQGVNSLYTITVAKSVSIEYHDVIKRVSDGKMFLVTSGGDGKHTPASATLNMRQVTAEEFTV